MLDERVVARPFLSAINRFDGQGSLEVIFHDLVPMLDLQRLYVSPLDPELLPIVLSGCLRESARNISYHTLLTFPEKRYGYLELPILEADRLKRKLHGSILKGVRMKVEKARPERAGKRPKEGNEGDTREAEKPRKVKKPSTTDADGVLPGVELPGERKVKRGWTEPGAKEGKKSTKRRHLGKEETARKASVHTNGPECLFKTKVPLNASANMPQDNPEAGKSKKRKRGQSERNIVVHEFEKTTEHANFLRNEPRSKDTQHASSYVEGKGWLDEDGNIVEAEPRSRSTRSSGANMASSIGRLVSARNTSAEQRAKRKVGRATQPETNGKQVNDEDDETSSSGTSDSGSEEETTLQDRELLPYNQVNKALANNEGEGREQSGGSEVEVNTHQVRALSISRSSPTPPSEPTKEVHPLEALFKRPQTAASHTPRKPSLEVKTAFSFFEPDVDQANNASMAIPQTPFTQQDFQERRLRSAAPTPDTAAPSKITFGRVWSWESGPRDSASDDEEGDDRSTPLPSSNANDVEANGEAKESEFATWFYEHRGETNRAWKRRRREAAKEKRQKENQRR